MINGTDYAVVLEVNEKATTLGLIIVPPEFTSSMIDSKRDRSDDLFRVRTDQDRYPMYKSRSIHIGPFSSVETFISGVYFLYQSLHDLHILGNDEMTVAARDMVLLDAIKNSGDQ